MILLQPAIRCLGLMACPAFPGALCICSGHFPAHNATVTSEDLDPEPHGQASRAGMKRGQSQAQGLGQRSSSVPPTPFLPSSPSHLT